MDIYILKDVATILSVAIALVALIKGYFEYRFQGMQKRAQHFYLFTRNLELTSLLIKSEICLKKMIND